MIKTQCCPECRERITFELYSADSFTNLIFLKSNLTISKTSYASICIFGFGNSTLGNAVQGRNTKGKNVKRTLYKNVHRSTINYDEKLKQSK